MLAVLECPSYSWSEWFSEDAGQILSLCSLDSFRGFLKGTVPRIVEPGVRKEWEQGPRHCWNPDSILSPDPSRLPLSSLGSLSCLYFRDQRPPLATFCEIC